MEISVSFFPILSCISKYLATHLFTKGINNISYFIQGVGHEFNNFPGPIKCINVVPVLWKRYSICLVIFICRMHTSLI
jgi:hypothetical protein